MIRKNVTAADAVALLKEALNTDSEAINKMMRAPHGCNDALANHPTIQIDELVDKHHTISPLGFLNGLFGVAEDGIGPIAAICLVECRRGHKNPDDAKAGEKCRTCDAILRAGTIIDFAVVREPGE